MTIASINESSRDLSQFVGTHFVYTYDNGWKYEWYARNETTCDYRIHKGLVGGRWVTHQKMNAVQFAPGIFSLLPASLRLTSMNQPAPASACFLI